MPLLRQLLLLPAFVLVPTVVGIAQGSGGATIVGRVVQLESGRPLVGVSISLEGASVSTTSDSGGRYRLSGVPLGPQVLLARRVGYAAARVSITVPTSGVVERDIEMAEVALRMRQVHVTADAVGRARGELGTASVITRDAIANQTATSLAGVLELIPGAILRPPGLDNVQQIGLRSLPTTTGTAERLGAFGTLIILDGIPLTNNTNLQTTGPRGEIVPATSAGGGIDLRRIPAAALERVEVIRGVPSARFGDLTAGAVVIDTRSGLVSPELLGRYDARTVEGNGVASRALPAGQQVSITADLAHTLKAPGVTDDVVWRAALDGAHRASFRGAALDDASGGGVVLDTRMSLFQVYENEPEQPDIHPGRFSSDRSGGVRLSERARIGSPAQRHLEMTASVGREWQDTRTQRLLLRGAEPFTDRLTPGRSIGHFVGGLYPALVHLQGSPWQVYARVEGESRMTLSRGVNTMRLGAELRREWNAGPGYQFAIEFPPQADFNGVNGYDRPRRYDEIPSVATTAPYLDDRAIVGLPLDMTLDVQAGVRAEILHTGTWWLSGARDVVMQPRLNAQLTPRSWLRLRAGWGRTAKLPALGDLYPAPQYYDVVNVNWYPPAAAERLAVLTTSILDPVNPQLGFAIGHKAEAGGELDIGDMGAAISVTAFRDVTTGAVAYDSRPTFLLREHFALRDSSVGTGRPPQYVTPAQAIDTVPVFLDRPENLQRVENRGFEWTVSLPEMSALQTRVEVSGAWTTSRLSDGLIDVGQSSRVTEFQLDSLKKRTPYWLGNTERGARALATARIVHHQPALGLVVTGTVQYFLQESTVQDAATDTLAWAGYVTRAGQLVPVALEQRGEAQYHDLRRQRVGLLTIPASPPRDWLLSLQVAKTVFTDGRIAFYAFNMLDRLGQPATRSNASRIFPRVRFGVELTVPLSPAHGAR